jgi:hypothetical protein
MAGANEPLTRRASSSAKRVLRIVAKWYPPRALPGDVPLPPAGTAAADNSRGRMDAGWLGSKEAATFVVAIAVLLVVAGVGVRILLRRTRAAAARRHVVEPSWAPLVIELVARGVTAPELLVCTLANYDFDLGPAGPARPSLPRAAATVAEVLKRPLAEVQAALVSRASEIGEAERLLEDLRTLRPRLEGLPGVVRVGEPWPADAAFLQQVLRRYARMSGV